jgi:hypothetical protein
MPLMKPEGPESHGNREVSSDISMTLEEQSFQSKRRRFVSFAFLMTSIRLR